MESKKNNQPEHCHVCGDIGRRELIMTCFKCRQVREHIYCARVCLRSVPPMWLCEVCRSPTGVLQKSNSVDNEEIFMPVDSPPCGLMLLKLALALERSCPGDKGKVDTPVTNDPSPSENHRQQFLAFPSPKRKRRTTRGRRKY